MAKSFIEKRYYITIFNFITKKEEEYRDDDLIRILKCDKKLYTLFKWGYLIPKLQEDYKILGIPEFCNLNKLVELKGDN